MARVYVSLGSNIERERHIRAALERLKSLYGPLEQSTVYESDAVGFDSTPFYNLVVGFDTDVEPHVIQEVLHAIESDTGRARTSELGARTLDLDLLLYDDLVITEPDLVLPRADITRYAFVLGPLAELAGDACHPVSGERYADMWADFDVDSQPMTPVSWPPA
ncbi:MAG: 2-amino-4-hydroxy-6-hydroxymethyldihydropteridine diphosphokinase [Pseudomonadota bacterium]